MVADDGGFLVVFGLGLDKRLRSDFGSLRGSGQVSGWFCSDLVGGGGRWLAEEEGEGWRREG